MDGSIRLSAKERKTLLQAYRAARIARRAVILLHLAEGWSYRQIMEALLASPAMIAAVKRDFAAGGVAQVLGCKPRPVVMACWLLVVVRWLMSSTPQDFGFFRSRWSCGLLALLLWQREGVRLSPETVRRGLHRMEFVWRRPRPVVGLHDPQHTAKLRRIRQFLAGLPPDETVVFQDEVDVHLNPKIGSCWMHRGQQAEVVTPGNNDKRHLAGSLHWRTGRLLLSPPGTRRNAALFVAHLDDPAPLAPLVPRHPRCLRQCPLPRLPRRASVPAAPWPADSNCTSSPKYAPETNPIERVWWHLHQELTRNHRCRSLDELLDQVYDWATAGSFYFQTASFREQYTLAA